MAVKKATTTSDLTAEDLTASAVDPTPTREDVAAGIVEHTSDEMVADVKAPKATKVKSPAGSVTEVPESIVQALLDSGYSKSK